MGTLRLHVLPASIWIERCALLCVRWGVGRRIRGVLVVRVLVFTRLPPLHLRRAIFYIECVCFLSSPSFLAPSRHQHYASSLANCDTTAGNINQNDEYKGGPTISNITIKCYFVSPMSSFSFFLFFLFLIQPRSLPPLPLSFVPPAPLPFCWWHGGVCWCCRVLLWNGKYKLNFGHHVALSTFCWVRPCSCCGWGGRGCSLL